MKFFIEILRNILDELINSKEINSLFVQNLYVKIPNPDDVFIFFYFFLVLFLKTHFNNNFFIF